LKKLSNKIISGVCTFKNNDTVFTESDSRTITKNCTKNILIITSEYFYETMIGQVEKIKNFCVRKTLNLNFNLKVSYLKNYFLGGNVKVAGLMTYYDFISWYNGQSSLNKKEFAKYDRILIPNIIFNKDGLTLDNKTQNDFLSIYENIRFIDPYGKSFLREIF